MFSADMGGGDLLILNNRNMVINLPKLSADRSQYKELKQDASQSLRQMSHLILLLGTC